MEMPLKQRGRIWEDDFFNIDFPDPPKEIVQPRRPGFEKIKGLPKFEDLEFADWIDSMAIAFQDAAKFRTRDNKKWNRRNPPDPFASRILRIFKDSNAPISRNLRSQFMLIPTIGTSADIYHGIDGAVCLSNGRPLITFDLSLDLSIKDTGGKRGPKADTVITPAHFDDDLLFDDLRDEMLQIVLRRLVQ